MKPLCRLLFCVVPVLLWAGCRPEAQRVWSGLLNPDQRGAVINEVDARIDARVDALEAWLDQALDRLRD